MVNARTVLIRHGLRNEVIANIVQGGNGIIVKGDSHVIANNTTSSNQGIRLDAGEHTQTTPPSGAVANRACARFCTVSGNTAPLVIGYMPTAESTSKASANAVEKHTGTIKTQVDYSFSTADSSLREQSTTYSATQTGTYLAQFDANSSNTGVSAPWVKPPQAYQGVSGGVSSITVTWTRSGTISNSHFQTVPPTTGSVTFGIDETEKFVNFTLASSIVISADVTLTLTLSNPVNATIQTAASTCTIKNETTSSPFVKVYSLIGLSRPSNQILRPTDAQLKNTQPGNANVDDTQNFNNVANFTSTTNATLDLRSKKFYHHSLNRWSGDGGHPGQNSPLRPAGFKNGLCIYGAEIIGEQPDNTIWRNMKVDNPAAMDDNGILYPNPSVPASATVYIEACVFRKSFDGINTDPRYGANRANKGHYIIRNCYAEKQRDEFVENDSCNYLEIYDVLCDSCHNFVSMRPGGSSSAIPPDYSNSDNWVKVYNCLARCRGQYYTTDAGGDALAFATKRDPQWEQGNSSIFVSNPTNYGPGWVHREPFKGDGLETFTNLNCTLWLDCKDSIFAFESRPTAGKLVFPPGTYSNVYLLYLPDLPQQGITLADLVDSRYVQDRGITVLTGSAARTMWNGERQNWITAHGGTLVGGLLTFPFTQYTA